MRQDGLPEPITRDEFYLAAILDRLGSIEDRLPVRPPPSAAGRVELTEPALTGKPVPPAVARERQRTRKGQPTT